MRIALADSDLSYYLVSFDKTGVERPEDAGLQSDQLKQLLAAEPDGYTDVFFVCHGWKGDVPAAIDQCNRWMGAMVKMGADRAAARALDPKFKPLLIGIHWPSQAWGEESLEDAPGASGPGVLGAPAPAASTETLVDQYADAIASTPAARAALETILTAAPQAQGQVTLDAEVVKAYSVLLDEADLWSDDGQDDGASMRDQWNPQIAYDQASQANGLDLVLGGGVKDAFLSPLRQISFWTMKSRARKVGETGVGNLLRQLQDATQRPVRFHLMGHSFGCIVVSAAIAGDNGKPLPRPVDSLFLVQGALSLWAYSRTPDNETGYFHRIVADRRVRGPIVTTWSTHDGAVGNLYPLAARLARQRTLVVYPKYGGVGAFGLQGGDKFAHEILIGDAATKYELQPGHIYNVEASKVICHGEGLSGAHSDIAQPEVAHIAWQAISASIGQ